VVEWGSFSRAGALREVPRRAASQILFTGQILRSFTVPGVARAIHGLASQILFTGQILRSFTVPGVARAIHGLTCSCGAAANRRLAKICSDINKPDGHYVLAPTRERVLDFVSTLPIRKVGGIGKVSERMLAEVFRAATCR